MSNGPDFIEQIAHVFVSLGPRSRKFKKPPPPPSSVQFGFPKSMARDGTANKFELQARRRRRREGRSGTKHSIKVDWRRETGAGGGKCSSSR